MIDLGMMKYFLVIEVTQSKDGIYICQSKYENHVLKIFRMVNYNPTITPITTSTKLSKEDEGSNVDPTLYKRLVSRLMCLIATGPDIMFVVSFIYIFMESPKSTHR